MYLTRKVLLLGFVYKFLKQTLLVTQASLFVVAKLNWYRIESTLKMHSVKIIYKLQIKHKLLFNMMKHFN